MTKIEIRVSSSEKQRWQGIAKDRGVSLSELVRSLLNGQRSRQPRRLSKIDPSLLRELARIGNNLNQIARAANRREPVPAVALLAPLIGIDRELAALRAVHERSSGAD